MNNVTKICFFAAIFLQVIAAQYQGEKEKVALLMSEEDSFISTEFEEQILEQITAWEIMLMNNNINYEVITVDQLDHLHSGKFDCLIIATNLFLEEDEWTSLQEYAIEFGKLFISASIQINTGNNYLTNRDAIQKLTGLSNISLVTNSNQNFSQVLNGMNQFTQDIEPGKRILLSGDQEVYSLVHSSSSKNALGYLELNSQSTGIIERQQSALYYGSHEKSKFIWFGFNYNHIIGGEEDRKAFVKLILNSIDWLKGKQYTAIGQWPDQKKSAFVFSPLINGRIDLTEKLLSVLEDYKLTADFLITENAVKDPALLQELSPYGNFGLYLTNPNEDKKKIINLISALKNITSKEIEYIGTNNILPIVEMKKELIESGIKIVVLDSYQKTRVPFFLDAEKKLLIVPATYTRMSDKIIVPSLLSDLGSYDNIYLDGINHWILDADFCEDKTESEIRNYLSNLANWEEHFNQSNYATTSIDIYEWILKRDKISIRVKKTDADNYEIEVKNKNNTPVENLVIFISDKIIKNEPTLYEYNKISSLNYEYDKFENKLKILIELLKSYESRRIKISLNEIM